MKNNASIGDRVRERRTALGLSQPQLAKKVGAITYQAIQQLEAGGGTKHLVAIARALGVTAEWLQDGQGPAPARHAPRRARVLPTSSRCWAWPNAGPTAGRCGTAMSST